MINKTNKKFQIRVFGKKGCEKCRILNQRLDKLLQEPKYSLFDKVYFDILTEDGLVVFCASECLNPSRIPAFIICELDELSGTYRPIPNPIEHPEETHPICKNSLIYSWLGLETDYSDVGKGAIPPKMIEFVLDQALAIVSCPT